MALSIASSAFAVNFNYQASSPTSPLYPTVNNGFTQMSLDPINNIGFSTSSDIAIASIRLNSAINGLEDIWIGVPFSIDLIIQDDETGKCGFFQIEGTISGITGIGKSMLESDSFTIFPSSQMIGGKTYVIIFTTYSFNAPGASSFPGIDGYHHGTVSVRVNATRVNKSRVASVMNTFLR